MRKSMDSSSRRKTQELSFETPRYKRLENAQTYRMKCNKTKELQMCLGIAMQNCSFSMKTWTANRTNERFYSGQLRDVIKMQ